MRSQIWKLQGPNSRMSKIQVIPNGKDRMPPVLFLYSAYCLYAFLLIKIDILRFAKDSYYLLLRVFPWSMRFLKHDVTIMKNVLLNNSIENYISSVQSLSCVWLFATPRIAARQASLSITNSGVHWDSRPSSQWCHPAISSSFIPFSSCPNPSQHQSLFQWVNSSHEVAKVLEFQL